MGYFHEFIGCQTKYPLVYDLQEPYRWLVDTSVISSLETGRFSKKDFYRMDNYVLRLRPGAARRLVDALRIEFNSPIRHAGKQYSWDTLVRLKAQELANYILGKKTDLGFDEPKPVLERDDSEAVRKLILSLTAGTARKLGVRKSTLWYLRQHAHSGTSFGMYSKVRMKLAQTSR